MNILLVDRDRLAVQSLQQWLESEGHSVVVEPVRKTALDLINQEHFDCVAIDPAPLPSVRQIALPLRWEQRDKYLYLVQLGHDMNDADVVRSGMNDKLLKPFAIESAQRVIRNAERLTAFMNELRQENLPGYDGDAFSPKALQRLVLSALDRSYRYGEQAYLLLIRISNFNDIVANIGEQAAGEWIISLSAYLSKLCRISDFLGHAKPAEFGLLLLRPAADREPQDAAERFSIALRDYQSQSNLGITPLFTIDLLALPSGELAERIQLD